MFGQNIGRSLRLCARACSSAVCSHMAWRVCASDGRVQGKGERNYHIFYFLIRGKIDGEEVFKLKTCDDYPKLMEGGSSIVGHGHGPECVACCVVGRLARAHGVATPASSRLQCTAPRWPATLRRAPAQQVCCQSATTRGDATRRTWDLSQVRHRPNEQSVERRPR